MKTGESSWSLAELVHAVVLLAHFHALASFVFGSGINTEGEEEIDDQRFQSVCSCDLTDSCSLEPERVFSGSPKVIYLGLGKEAITGNRASGMVIGELPFDSFCLPS